MSFLEKVRTEVRRKQAKAKLKRTPVTESVLLGSAFTRDVNTYVMGDLIIYKIGIEFYYKKPDGHLELIKNVQTVSDLVYGHIQYFK